MSENNINLIFAVTNPVVPLYQVRSSADHTEHMQHHILFKLCSMKVNQVFLDGNWEDDKSEWLIFSF